jgi:hypothetical protein
MGITIKVVKGALPENAKMTKSVVSEEEARKILADGNAMQISENSIRITPRWW